MTDDERLPVLESALWRLGDCPAPITFMELTEMCRLVTPDVPDHPQARRLRGSRLAGRVVQRYHDRGDVLVNHYLYDVAGLRDAVAEMQPQELGRSQPAHGANVSPDDANDEPARPESSRR